MVLLVFPAPHIDFPRRSFLVADYCFTPAMILYSSAASHLRYIHIGLEGAIYLLLLQ